MDAAAAAMTNRSPSKLENEEPPGLLSTKDIAPRDRLIVALDVDTIGDAVSLVDRLGDSVGFYKVGLQLLVGAEGAAVIDMLRGRGKKVFADWKVNDIPRTVRAAVRQLHLAKYDLGTVIFNEGVRIGDVAKELRQKGSTKVLAVTVLTSLSQADVDRMWGPGKTVEEHVVERARLAMSLGFDGVIASALEARRLRLALGPDAYIVTPGIRPAGTSHDDQKRVATPRKAFWDGADHIVVGRPIYEAPDPKGAAEAIQQTIRELFPKP